MTELCGGCATLYRERAGGGGGHRCRSMGLTGLNGHGRGSPVESKASQPPADGKKVQDTRKAIYSQGGLQGNNAVPDKEGFWWLVLLTETSWEANSCGRCFPPHCAVQALARCTEIRGDLDSTVFSRWPRAQQPPAPVERLWGKNRVSRWIWMGQQVGHAAGRRLIPARGVPFASCGSTG